MFFLIKDRPNLPFKSLIFEIKLKLGLEKVIQNIERDTTLFLF